MTPSRALTKAHVSFIAGHFYPSISDTPGYSELQVFIALHILFPQLIFSKVRSKSTSLVWEILESCEKQASSSSISSHELFRGCIEAVRWEEGKAPKETSEASYERTQTMADANVALAAKLAGKLG
jgi:U3 small nucleolar RNA-associated protein 10